MKHGFTFLIFFFMGIFFWYCGNREENRTHPQESATIKLRGLADTVGFAHTAEQMDSLINRIDRLYGRERRNILQIRVGQNRKPWQVIISPHDDYSYAGDVYPYVLKDLSASTVIIFGVAHKARQFGTENRIVFDSFTHWRGPYGDIPVSEVRNEIMTSLPKGTYLINDSLQEAEHSVEALLPFLQYYHRSLEIVSILVPYMSYSTMTQIARPLAKAIHKVAAKHEWQWGPDFALAISNDCVHYGDRGWGGKNFARFGADSAGYQQAVNYDMNIINQCLIDQLHPQRLRRFVNFTVKKENYKEYAWTWCGRYSVPFGLLTAFYLQEEANEPTLAGKMLRYGTSLSHPPIPVEDLGMGTTAPANIRHWVGYTAIGYHFQ